MIKAGKKTFERCLRLYAPARWAVRAVGLGALLWGLGMGMTASAVRAQADARQEATFLRLHNLDVQRISACDLVFLDEEGLAVRAAHTVEILPQQIATVDLTTLSLPLPKQGGEFSGLVDCTRRTSAVLFYGDAPNQIHTGYAGLNPADAAREWQILQAFTGQANQAWTSRIVLQNSVRETNTVEAQFIEGGTRDLVHALTVAELPGLASYALDLAQIPELKRYAEVRVRLVATHPLVALVFHTAAEPDSVSVPLSGPQTVYVPAPRAETRLFVPGRLLDFRGFDTEVLLLNPGAQVARVTVTYPRFGERQTEIDPGELRALRRPSFLPSTDFIAPMVIASSEPIYALTQTRQAEGPYATLAATTAAGTRINAPLVLKRAGGFSSVVVCQNVSEEATEIIFEYVGLFARIKWVRPHRNEIINLSEEQLLPDGFDGAMLMRSEQPIKCAVFQMRDALLSAAPANSGAAPPPSPALLVYEGLAIE